MRHRPGATGADPPRCARETALAAAHAGISGPTRAPDRCAPSALGAVRVTSPRHRSAIRRALAPLRAEAIPAVHGTSLARLERHGRRRPARGTHGLVRLPRSAPTRTAAAATTTAVPAAATTPARPAAVSTTAAALSLALVAALTATLGLVGETTLSVARLIFGGVNELLPAVGTDDGFVFERHVEAPPSVGWAERQRPDSRRCTVTEPSGGPRFHPRRNRPASPCRHLVPSRPAGIRR